MSLVPRFVLGDLDLTEYPFAVEFGSDLGNPENTVDILGSLLADGEVESLSRRSNRTLTIPVLIEGGDLAELALAEQALIAECDKQRNTLAIDPGDGFGPATVFDTFTAQPQRTYGDAEEMANVRRWTLTIQALPYGRSVTKVVDDAGTPPSAGGTLLYNCESTTGWADWYGPGSAVVDTTVFTEGAGSIRTQAHAPNISTGTHYVYFYWMSQSFDEVTGLSLETGTGGYLSLAVRIEYADVLPGAPAPGLKQLLMQVDGAWVEVSSYVAARVDADGFVHYVWAVDDGLTITGLRMKVQQVRWDNTGNATGGFAHDPFTWYDDVELLPAATTDHQIVKQLTVEGSARTTGALRVAAPSESVALGQVLVATAPSLELPAGFQPDGRRWVTQGATTSDTSVFHGSYFTPDSSDYSDSSSAPAMPIFEVPVTTLTAGPYTMVGLVMAEASSLTFGVQAQLRIDGTNVGPTSEAEVTPQDLSTGWQFVTVGTVYLPPLPMQSAGAGAKVRLLFKGAKFADVYFIPAWQVGGRSVADFSIVDCGTGAVGAGGASSSLWIDSPSVAQPQGGWWRGPTQDRANARSAWPDAKKPGIHTFNPGSLTAFLVSTGAAGPTLTLEYFPSWYGNAAS